MDVLSKTEVFNFDDIGALAKMSQQITFFICLHSFSHVALNTSSSVYLTEDHTRCWKALHMHMLLNSK